MRPEGWEPGRRVGVRYSIRPPRPFSQADASMPVGPTAAAPRRRARLVEVRTQRRFRYQDHGLEVGAISIDDYDVSANATISAGERFEYIDSNSGLARVGYFDRATELLSVLDSDELVIITHFKPDRKGQYVRDVPNSTCP
jgi:hypothetical protein